MVTLFDVSHSTTRQIERNIKRFETIFASSQQTFDHLEVLASSRKDRQMHLRFVRSELEAYHSSSDETYLHSRRLVNHETQSAIMWALSPALKFRFFRSGGGSALENGWWRMPV